MKTINEVAKMGGLATKEKYGTEHYSKLGKKGGSSLKKKYGKDYFKKIRRGISPKNKY